MLRCTGCGSTDTIEEIRAKHPEAIACCPERDMRPFPEPWVIRKGGAFYRPDRAGYTNHIEAAGIYTREEAEAEASVEPGKISAIPLRSYRAEIIRNFEMSKRMLDLLNITTN